MADTLVIGLGTFGLAIARRLQQRRPGSVIGVDADASRRALWQEAAGARAHENTGALDAGDAPPRRAFVAVRTQAQVTAVLRDLEDWHSRMPAAPVDVYIVTTLSPSFAREVFAQNPGALRYVEFPVTGGEAAARAGKLVAMAAGLCDAGERALLLEHLAARIVDFPRFGDPALAKLLNNASIAYQAAALEEVLRIGAGHGLAAGALLEVISNGAATSFISTALSYYNDALLEKDLELLRTCVPSLPGVGVDGIRDRFASMRSLLARNTIG